MGVHGLTQITGILGPAKAVSCHAGIAEPIRVVRSGAFDGKEIVTGVPDNYLITLDFGDACFAVVDSSYVVKAANGPSLEIFGSAGTVSIGGPGTDRQGGAPFDLYLDDAARGVRGWTQPMYRMARAQQAVGVTDLVAAIREGRSPILTGAHARHVLEIMNACPVAAQEGRTVHLETTFDPA
jgi:predicted dehydrogenase